MDFMEAIKSGFQNYVNFQGRAQRSAFWYWALFAFIVGTIAGVIDSAIVGPQTAMGPLSAIASLGLLLPGIAVNIRRLHDLDRSGWWLLLLFIPIIGAIWLIVWYCTPGTPGSNRFGPNPLG